MRCTLVCVALALGCYEDRYQCTDDAQCDLGEGGRCERDGFCTVRDITCTTERRYAAHAGALTATCYDDSAELANPCAGGQGPARAEGCVANVCERLPACCSVAWTDACVQIAQEECALSCDTRIAITAHRQTTIELWDARWAGDGWTIERRDDLASPFGWVAPEPGAVEPRLVGTTPAGLAIGGTTIATAPGRTYQEVTSIGFDRDHSLAIAASYTSDAGSGIEIRRLEDDSVRDMAQPAAASLTWGDLDRDGYPDAIVRAGSTYSLLENVADGQLGRKLATQSMANVTGGPTPGSPNLSAIGWLDANRDGALDLAVFGMSVRLHTDADGLRDVAQFELDCLPPSTTRSCTADPEPNLESAAFTGAALPTADSPSVVIAQFPGRKLFRARVQGDAVIVAPLPFPGDTCSCIANCNANNCPGANCTCNYDCSACAPVLALVARDLDGDRRLDLVAIDAKLRLYTAFAASDFAWTAPVAIPTTFGMNFRDVSVSVTGAPSP